MLLNVEGLESFLKTGEACELFRKDIVFLTETFLYDKIKISFPSHKLFVGEAIKAKGKGRPKWGVAIAIHTVEWPNSGTVLLGA